MGYSIGNGKDGKVWLVCITCILVIVAPSAAKPRQQDFPGHHFSFNKPPDAETLAIIRSATHVETYRVDGYAPLRQATPPSASEKEGMVCAKVSTIDGYPISAYGPTCGKAFAGRLSAVVSDPQSYASEGHECIIVPGVVFRVWKGKAFADVILCFRCSQIVILGYDSSGQMVSQTSGVMRARDTFVQLAQKAFPHDSELR